MQPHDNIRRQPSSSEPEADEHSKAQSWNMKLLNETRNNGIRGPNNYGIGFWGYINYAVIII